MADHAEEKKEEPKVQAPVLKVDLESNVEESVAYSLLDDWAKKLGKEQDEQLAHVRGVDSLLTHTSSPTQPPPR